MDRFVVLEICDFTMIPESVKVKKDNQEWKPPNCLIYKPFGLVAGPGIEPGTS